MTERLMVDLIPEQRVIWSGHSLDVVNVLCLPLLAIVAERVA